MKKHRMKVALVGSVNSSRTTLLKLIEHHIDVVAVFGLRKEDVSGVSGFVDLEEVAVEHGIDFYPFAKVNSIGSVLKRLNVDLLFVIGLSQLVSDDIMCIPTHGCVGFHPTGLPRGRGRAPLAWLVACEDQGAASFFKLGNGVDDGPIYIQRYFEIEELDSASTVMEKVQLAISDALDVWLPTLRSGVLRGVPQDERLATYYGRRSKEDGLLDWSKSAGSLATLVRCSTAPYPGAYTFCQNVQVVVWEAEQCLEFDMQGMPGRILKVLGDNRFYVQCGDGSVLLVNRYDTCVDWIPRAGMKLGYYLEEEVFQLKKSVAELSVRLDALLKIIPNDIRRE